jgi:phage/conjugal plasmid C-4 type zinc finger TraR family protein
MANGWARDGAIQEQIDATLNDAINHARNQLPSGKSRSHCEECGMAIPEARRKAVVGVRLCINCQLARELE